MNERWGCLALSLLIILVSRTAAAQPLSTASRDPILTNNFDVAHAALSESLRVTSLETGAVIPRNYAFPLLEWESQPDADSLVLIQIASSHHHFDVVRKGHRWQPGPGEFSPFLNDPDLTITIYAHFKGMTVKSKPIRLVVSERPLTDPIAFRLVEPLFNANQNSVIQLFLWDRPVPQEIARIPRTCIGCHGYSSQLDLFNIRKGTDRRWVMVLHDKTSPTLAQKIIGDFSFFSISPDGKDVAVVMNARGKIKTKDSDVEPFDLPYETGDIFIYDLAQQTLKPLPGASELDYVEDQPCFSPDGKEILFVRYQYQEEGIPSMALYRVPFNHGEGGKPIPVGAANLTPSYEYFPHYSPDGKWFSFCGGDGKAGYFARASSDIYLLSRDERRLIKLNFNREGIMDSWHSWCSDSHWLAIASNREKSNLTALYLVYLDDQGKDYPPVKLIGYDSLKINLPQFVPKHGAFLYEDRFRDFVDSLYTETKRSP